MLAILGRSWAYTGGPGRLLEPVLAVLVGAYVGGLGPLWALCWRSWAALGSYVGGLGPQVGGLGPLLAVLGGLGPKSGRSWGGIRPAGIAPNAGIAPIAPMDRLAPKPSLHFF